MDSLRWADSRERRAGDSFGDVADPELGLGDVGVNDRGLLAVVLLGSSGQGGPAGFDDVVLIARSHVGGELEGGHAAGVQEASPGAFAVRAGSAGHLADEQLRREVNSGLQVAENRNSANDKIFYGREGVLSGADHEHAEVSMLALRLLRSSPVFINTQLLQAVLRAPAWANKLAAEDRRALTSLFWAHVIPYGRFHLAMDSRLDLGTAV
ncbi:Tn3 family transposase [Streptosporangium roseum]|uniref:Tn3 transposase DDE domain-containing protein n=1 Tax=Streptosporangium roseum (strain ATCC 12428 / DSM 43021 / JCM 3005 / KCTC 9067 / NCIMB 10171 / NRRL 2505 / NI 9100) TaxID=479432 RepID=D2AZ73_STRRD|nr:Tn3 family transposase [Streptosporangium roseum]ACZ83258.1 hypothetical protein Sros_0217 [Streptosporangium roseum DSM 43021]